MRSPRWLTRIKLGAWVALAVLCLPLLVLAVVLKHVGDLSHRVAKDVADALGREIESHA